MIWDNSETQSKSPRQPQKPLNPVAFVSVKRPKPGLKRMLAIAEGAKDVFSVGEAVVDGVMFYHYATGAKAAVGIL